MKRVKHLFYLFFLFLFISLSAFSQIKTKENKKILGAVTASFTAPDTVCTNTSVQITNTTVGASNYYWSFCEANFNITPTGTDLGDPGNLLSLPVFTDIAQDASGNYFLFVVNNFPGKLIRMNFGNSLLNTPVVDNMGDFGVIPPEAEGIQVVNINGNWTIVINGGDPNSGTASAIVKIDLGTSLASTTGVGTSWGNIGGLSYPHDLYIFTENNNWYGYTVNADNNTVTLFNFGADFSATPTGVNLGNIGNLNIPVGLGAINNAGTWHLFITNAIDNTITRLDFGNSLLNTPTAVNIGNPGNTLDNPRDISFVQLCNNTEGYVVNALSNTLTRLDFGTNLTSTPIATNLGNVGNLNFPHSISKLFRVNSDVYAFVPNVNTNALTQLHFSGCSTPGSTLQNPANVTYSSPGTYNINLLVDLGLPTQTSYCKQIVVKDCPLNACSDWLNTPTQPSAVEVGQLNVTGNVITVEAEINRTTPYVGGTLYAGDIVSKHSGPNDANYLLRPNEAEITTSDGYFRTPDICEIELNKTYHVAMVYDGATLKFYRNGFLMSQTPATGTLYQNTWATRIGYYVQGLYNENFIGYTNEVRIWNVARTQAQLQAYMNTSLPSPTTQTGLLAYYTFNDLTNKQGNPAWNGTLVGSAAINQTNPQCVFVADSCCPVLSGTLTGGSICTGSPASLTFNTTSTTGPFTLKFINGTDTITQTNILNNVPFTLATSPLATTKYILLSIKDTTSCSASFVTGDTATVVVTACTKCSEWLHITTNQDAVDIGDLDVPGNTITVEANVNLSLYNITYGQDLVSKHRDPSDANYLLRQNHAEITTSDGFFTTPIICDDSVNKTYHLAMVYDGSTLKYYRNGFLMEQVPATGNLLLNDYNTKIGNYAAVLGQDDEALWGYINEVRIWNVARTQAQIQAYMNTSLPSPTTQTGLLAYYVFNDLTNKQGNAAWNGTLTGSAAINQTNPNCVFIADSCCTPLTGILKADTLCKGSGNITLTFIAANGTAPFTLTYTDGTNTLTQNNVQSNVPFVLQNQPTANTTYGLISIKDSSTCAATNVLGLTPEGYFPIIKATVVINPLPQAQLTASSICAGDDGKLLFTATTGSAPYTIQYNNGTTAYTLANLSADSTFTVPYQVTDTTTFTLLNVADSNGCINNINTSAIINVNPLPQGSISGNTACASDSASITFTSTLGNGPFTLILSDGTNAITYDNILSGTPFKIAPLNTTTTISLISITNKNGCIRTTGFTSPSATITVTPSPQIQFDSLGSICIQNPPFIISQAKEISGISGSGIFSGQGVDASGNFSPLIAGAGSDTITYTYTADNGCAASKSENIIVNQNPVANAGPDLIACINISLQLNATGGDSYAWAPPTGLNNDSIPNPIATLTSSTTYTVTVTDANGCTASDSVVITVSPVGKALYVLPNAFTPNGDGKNDCFGIQHWGGVDLQEFTIYNRWGQLVFVTKNPSECWDGSFHGKIQDAGTYVYIIRAETPCGQVSLKGTVILIR